MADKLHLDFETRSAVDLRSTGVYRYAEDRSTEIICLAYKLGRGNVHSWRRGEPFPEIIIEHAIHGGTITAHNAHFEYLIWNIVLRRTYPGVPLVSIAQMDCTMARAMVLNFPADLETLAKVLGLAEQKDKEGERVMKRITKPRRFMPDGTILWWDDPDMLDRVVTYCMQDVRAEVGVDDIIPPLSPTERRIWELDQRINNRGVAIDLEVVIRAATLTNYAKVQASAEIRRLTGGAVSGFNDLIGLKAWLNDHNVYTDTLRKGDIDGLLVQADLADEEDARYAIEIRSTATKTSTAKYEKMLECVNADGHLRDLLQYYGAKQTGRWAGRTVQPQNFPRMDDASEGGIVETIVGWLGDTTLSIETVYGLIELIGPPDLPNGDKQRGLATLAWLSKCLRSMLIAKPNTTFVGGDFSNIEGRVNAWLSDETWKIEAFQAYDAGTGPDIYKLAFARAFNLVVEAITKPQRQIGKVMELALGYQGGVGAFLTLAQTYLLKVHELAAAVKATADHALWETTAAKYDNAFDRYDLPRDYWTAIKIIVNGWRKAHPNIVSAWRDLQAAAVHAVQYPNVQVPVYNGKCYYVFDGNILYCVLPSGRPIYYPSPYITREVREQIFNGKEYVDTDSLLSDELDALIRDGYNIVITSRTVVKFFSVSEIGRWQPQALYGGFQAENIVQAVSRDVMAEAMLRAEPQGNYLFPLCLTVHDELLAVVPSGVDYTTEFTELMEQRPTWAYGLPVVAQSWMGTRYNK